MIQRACPRPRIPLPPCGQLRPNLRWLVGRRRGNRRKICLLKHGFLPLGPQQIKTTPPHHLLCVQDYSKGLYTKKLVSSHTVPVVTPIFLTLCYPEGRTGRTGFLSLSAGSNPCTPCGWLLASEHPGSTRPGSPADGKAGTTRRGGRRRRQEVTLCGDTAPLFPWEQQFVTKW